MIDNPSALLGELHARGLAPAPLPDAGDDAEPAAQRPWYIVALLGISGWIAGLFMLAFVGMLFQPRDAPQAAVAGIVLLAAAWGLFKADRDGAFTSQLALALSIAGQCLVLFSLTEHERAIGSIAAAALVLQIVLAVVMPNALHRLLSTFFATIAWALTVRFLLFGEPDFLRKESGTTTSLSTALAAWMLTWIPVGAALWTLIRREASWMARGWQAVLRPMLTGLIVGLAFATLVSQPFESFRWWGDGSTERNWLALWPMLSALAALGGAAAAFALRSRALIGACVVGALLHVSHFYYELGTGLLIKSMLMLAMGAAMWWASRALAAGERS
jgi:hypothetical protein